LGIAAVFGPGTPLHVCVDFIRSMHRCARTSPDHGRSQAPAQPLSPGA
jgi:hypothetical protein